MDGIMKRSAPVSYTHLDVYKRQSVLHGGNFFNGKTGAPQHRYLFQPGHILQRIFPVFPAVLVRAVRRCQPFLHIKPNGPFRQACSLAYLFYLHIMSLLPPSDTAIIYSDVREAVSYTHLDVYKRQAYMFLFPGTPLQNTLILMVLCNIVHYFSTPYLMMKNSLSKMNAGWETTAMLMGDSWLKTIVRVITPNALSSLLEVFSYYFINSMVTISALVFIAGARTMVLTTKIKQLQYINKFNEVFVLSLLILATNLAAKALFSRLAKKISNNKP